MLRDIERLLKRPIDRAEMPGFVSTEDFSKVAPVQQRTGQNRPQRSSQGRPQRSAQDRPQRSAQDRPREVSGNRGTYGSAPDAPAAPARSAKPRSNNGGARQDQARRPQRSGQPARDGQSKPSNTTLLYRS